MMRANAPADKNSPEYLRSKISAGRYSMMLVTILTAVNLLMVLLDADRYFLFSASVPYYLVFLGKGIENGFSSGNWSVNGTLTYTGLAIALVILVVYAACWLLSKKRTGWITAALVLFSMDTVVLAGIAFVLYDNPAAKLVDFLLHIWAIVEMAQAVRAGGKLKALAAAEEPQGVYTGPEL